MTSRSRRLLISLACVALAGLSYSLGATAFAESDRWTRCRSGDPDTRIAACTRIIVRPKRETKRDLVTAYVNRGDAYFARSEFDRAVADYSDALRLDRSSAPAFSGRGRAYRSKGDFDKALADFDAAVRLNPNSAQLRIDRGAVHRARGDLDRAIADYSEAIQRDPSNPEAFLHRGVSYRGKRDFDREKQDLEAALRLDPQFTAVKDAFAEVNQRIAERTAPSPPAPPMAPPVPLATLATADRLGVVAFGSALIAFIVWFFWLKRTKGVHAAETAGGYQEAMILVKGGYTPDTIIVRSGKPVRLNFRREETASCSDKVIFADFQKSADLPTGETVVIELLPKERGEFGFACPMGMFRGRLVVE